MGDRLKRIFDVAGSAGGLVVMSPALVATAVVGAFHFRGSPFVGVERVGQGGDIFTMWKFKSMTDARDEAGNLLPDEQRLTKFGRFIRHTSIDELPQLVNILRGEMSFVGPRPRSTGSDGDDYVPEELKEIMFSVKPGLTGPWQVYAIGRDKTSPEERLSYDLSYVNSSPSFGKDIKLVVQSVASFVKGHDGSQTLYQVTYKAEQPDSMPQGKMGRIVYNGQVISTPEQVNLLPPKTDKPEPGNG